MSSWHSYPKVWNIGHPAVSELFSDEVIIEEKIDGSQFSFGRFGNELKCKSKGKDLFIDAPEKMFSLAVATVKTLFDSLKDGYTYRAEYLISPKHNTIKYDRAPRSNLILFDVSPSEEAYLSYGEKRLEASRLDLECVPLLSFGKIENANELETLLEKVSFLGGSKIEGFVVKNYKKFGPDKKVLLGKYVSEAFKELHETEWKASNPGRADVLEELIKELKSTARFEKAVQHLRDEGRLQCSAKDIGSLIVEVKADAKEECARIVKERLFHWAWPQIERSITGGLPEWYKKHLMLKQFETQESI